MEGIPQLGRIENAAAVSARRDTHVDNAFRTCGMVMGPEDCSDLTAENTYWLRLQSLQSSLARFRKEVAAVNTKLSEISWFVDAGDEEPQSDMFLSVQITPDAPAEERVEVERPPLAVVDGNIEAAPFEESGVCAALFAELLSDDFVCQFGL